MTKISQHIDDHHCAVLARPVFLRYDYKAIVVTILNDVTLYIKYMVSLRCKMVVKDELEKLGLHWSVVNLGLVDIREEITEDQRNQLRANLLSKGLELLDDHKSILVERIKNVVVEMIHYADELPCETYSEYISNKLGYNYTYLSNLFAKVTATSIQQFIIAHKIEKAKELLLYEELNISEIAYLLHYISPAHLSIQFKKITGLSPSWFKRLKQKRISNLENL